jgi:hypothetical protein
MPPAEQILSLRRAGRHPLAQLRYVWRCPLT